jgi:multiple sugar transport system substrate-binding protein
LEALDSSRPRPRTPEWAKIESILGVHLNRAFIARSGSKAELDAAAQEIHDYLASMNYYD